MVNVHGVALQRSHVKQGRCNLIFPDPVRGGPASSVNRLITTGEPERLGTVQRQVGEAKHRYAAVTLRRTRSWQELRGATSGLAKQAQSYATGC